MSHIYEEDDKCPKCYDGVIGYERVKGCTCLINPPCSACVDNPLVCLSCGWQPGEEDA